MDNQNAQPALRRSQPYSVRVRNISDSVLPVKLFDNDWLFDPASRNRNILIDSSFPNVSYFDLCVQLNSAPARIGSVIMNFVSDGNESARLLRKYTDTLWVHTRDSNGTAVKFPLTFHIDPYQFQDRTFVRDEEFNMDYLTTIEFELPGNTEITLRIFPVANVNSGRVLNGKDALMQYSRKSVIEPHVTVVQSVTPDAVRMIAKEEITRAQTQQPSPAKVKKLAKKSPAKKKKPVRKAA